MHVICLSCQHSPTRRSSEANNKLQGGAYYSMYSFIYCNDDTSDSRTAANLGSFGYSLQGVQWEGGAVDGGSIT